MELGNGAWHQAVPPTTEPSGLLESSQLTTIGPQNSRSTHTSRLADVNTCNKWRDYGRILQEKGLVTQFAFYSKGGHLWATTSSHFQVEPEEFTYLTAGFQDASALRQRGLRVGGSHYTVTRLSNRGSIIVTRDAASGHGCVICCCSRCVIVAAYEEGAQLGACYNAMERLSDFLLDKGF